MGWNGEREEEKEREVRTERRTDVARIAKGSSLTPPLSLPFASSSFSSYSTQPAKLLYEETTAGK